MNEKNNLTHAQIEERILDYWDKYECFKKSVENRPAGNPYVFYDGPPFATGLPHYGHIVASVMKDVVPRFWTMKGYRVDRIWGWDCHGLPIENIVEKEQQLASRKDIEKFGIAQFNEACQAKVLTYAQEWKKVIRRLGRWVDMENAYKTMDAEYMESIWWVFKSLFDKGLIYEGRKPMHICPRCETVLSNFEVTQGYKDVTDISVVATLPIISGKWSGADILVWTTTPWTLPGNVLAAVSPKHEYALVEYEGKKYILLSSRVQKWLPNAKVLETCQGRDLIGATYKPLFDVFQNHQNAFRVVAADFVTTEEGTGIVHIAPGFGENDMTLGQVEQVDPIMHVTMNGQFVPEVVGEFDNAGEQVSGVPVRKKEDPNEADVYIIKFLAHNGRLFAKEKITHSYPHCWRCDTPLLNYSTSSWFVRVTDIKEKLVKSNSEITWVPENMKEGRFGKWLEGAHDWAISRSRFWGTPLPIWKSEAGDIICVGSRAELKEFSCLEVNDLHKHIVDKIVIEKDGKKYYRIDEVLDCWFESGSMPYAQLHYPFENEHKFDQGFPAEFIAEGQDQTRGWFYTLHILANALFGMPAFKNVIVNGIVLAEDGKKMSKRLNNYPDPMVVMRKYGADAVRYYLMSTPVVCAENLRFSEAGVDEVAKKFINILRNVLSFYQLYAMQDDGRVPHETHVLDAWIISRLNQTLLAQTQSMEAYELSEAARVLQGFVTDLSTWYVRRSRDRVKAEDDDSKEALATLRTVLNEFAKMLAPFMPFLAEHVYQGVAGDFTGTKERLSVHLEQWPEAGDVAERVIAEMGDIRAIVSRALEAREEAGRAVKQVLAGMTVSITGGTISQAYIDVLKDEVNVKEIIVKDGELAVELDTALTPELIREGMAREVIRKVNQMRKDAGLTIEDRITLVLASTSDEVTKMLSEHARVIQCGALATSIKFEKNDSLTHKQEFRVSEQDLWIGF